ncbi:MAG: DUF2088 domain-containing protein [Acidobacteriota bacterium]|nr:MAG: DUF2088 domain-containing protein [Acidobacteriota bacterium]
MIGIGFHDRHLTDQEIESTLKSGLASVDVQNKKILVIIPDRTRTAPIPKFFRLLHRLLNGSVAKLDYLVALGTHTPLSDSEMNELVGITAEERRTIFKEVTLHNHLWERKETFTTLGTITADEIREIASEAVQKVGSDVGLVKDLSVTINRLVLDYDILLICGPTFPHEVVGFSGGNKYFFPGISGPEVINYSHWLGAVISSYKIIGTMDTPVRRVINRAASMINSQKLCCSLVVDGDQLSGVYFGTPEEAYQAAAELSSQIHIKWVDQPYKRVLSVMPKMYDDIWTGAKGMYKMEPVIADGGEVVIYAPHIDEISYTHGELLDEIGYHVAEYFLKQWDRFKEYPGGVLAHSTHCRGMGQYDAETGVESPRIKVTLATGIPEARCRQLGLGYIDPAQINPETWEDQGDGCLLVRKAGEILYRLKP